MARGDVGPWCAEKTSFGSSCVLFQSGSSKKVAIQCVYVCALTVELHTWVLPTLFMSSEGFPHTCYFCSISNPNPTRCSLCTRVPWAAPSDSPQQWDSASCSRTRSCPWIRHSSLPRAGSSGTGISLFWAPPARARAGRAEQVAEGSRAAPHPAGKDGQTLPRSPNNASLSPVPTQGCGDSSCPPKDSWHTLHPWGSGSLSQVQGHQDVDDPGDGGEQAEEEAEEDQGLRLSGCHVRLGHVPAGERSPGLARGRRGRVRRDPQHQERLRGCG